MLNELQEFQAYTEAPSYAPGDYLGRFTVENILDSLGLERVLTIIARGYLFRDGNAHENIAATRNALCAWCSIPDDCTKLWNGQFSTCFPELHSQFPELVDAQGNGWYIRHIGGIIAFAKENPKQVKLALRKVLPKLEKELPARWRKTVRAYQSPIFLETTDALWQLRFDDIIANALTLGPLREMEAEVTAQQKDKLEVFATEGVKLEHLVTLVAYYEANKPEDGDWVVLPASNFNAFLGSTSFSKKVLPAITSKVIERSPMSHGSGRYRILPEFQKTDL